MRLSKVCLCISTTNLQMLLAFFKLIIEKSDEWCRLKHDTWQKSDLSETTVYVKNTRMLAWYDLFMANSNGPENLPLTPI